MSQDVFLLSVKYLKHEEEPFHCTLQNSAIMMLLTQYCNFLHSDSLFEFLSWLCISLGSCYYRKRCYEHNASLFFPSSITNKISAHWSSTEA